MSMNNNIILSFNYGHLFTIGVVVELSIKCSSLIRLIFFFETEHELITELDNMIKFCSFIFRTSLSLFTSYLINLIIPYIK
jgi:hypothetical protein